MSELHACDSRPDSPVLRIGGRSGTSTPAGGLRRSGTKVAIALSLALALAGCNPPEHDIAVTGTPATVTTTSTPDYRPLTIAAGVRAVLATTTTTVAPSRPGRVVMTPATKPAGAPASVDHWRGLVARHFPGEVDRALAVMACESGGNPGAASPTDDHGLMQINRPTWARPGHPDPVADWIGRHWDHVYDPEVNLTMAAKIRATPRGWQHWVCAR